MIATSDMVRVPCRADFFFFRPVCHGTQDARAFFNALSRYPEAYVYRVACNLAIDRLRGNRFCRSFGDLDDDPGAIPDDAPSPARIAEARSELARVARALDDLPRRYNLSVRCIDTVPRQALDYCAEDMGRPVMAGTRGPRRVFRNQGLFAYSCDAIPVWAGPGGSGAQRPQFSANDAQDRAHE